jgi:hypothetical protein
MLQTMMNPTIVVVTPSITESIAPRDGRAVRLAEGEVHSGVIRRAVLCFR